MAGIGRIVDWTPVGAAYKGVTGKHLGDELGLSADDPGAAPNPDNYFTGSRGQIDTLYGLGIGAAGYTHPSEVTTPGQIVAPVVAPTTVERPDHITASPAAAVRGVTSRDVLDPGETRIGPLAPVERIGSFGELNSRDVGPIAVGRAAIDPEAISLQRAAAEGKAPSEAEALMRLNADKIAQKQFSLAAGARGAERGGARREAMLAVGQQGADLGNQIGAMRAKEMETARSSFAQTSVAAAQLEQQINALQAQIDQAIAQGNQREANALQVQQSQLEAKRQELNQGAENQRTMDEATLRAKLSEGGKERSAAIGAGNAARALGAGEFTAGAENVSALDLVRRQDETEQQYQARLARAREFNAGAENAIGVGNADRAFQGQRDTANLTLEAQRAKDEAAFREQQLRLGGIGAASSATGQKIGIEGLKYDAAAREHAAAVARAEAARAAGAQAIYTGAGYALGGPAGGQIGASMAPKPAGGPAYAPGYSPSGYQPPGYGFDPYASGGAQSVGYYNEHPAWGPSEEELFGP